MKSLETKVKFYVIETNTSYNALLKRSWIPILSAICASRPRSDVAYCIHALARRLSKTQNWAVALKTLMVIHRALNEICPSFYEELSSYGRTRSHMLNLSYFKDDSSAYAWDYSAWVRTYALYLEERHECFHVLKYNIDIDSMKTRDLETAELLVQLPALQQLLYRLLNCHPQGAALYNLVIRLALSMVAVESINIYNAISEGTINLVEKFFEMQRCDAVKAFEIYRRSFQQSEILSEFYETCKRIGIRCGEEFNMIKKPPASFLTTMEEYVKEAPRASIFRKDQVKDEKVELKAILSTEEKKAPKEQQSLQPSPSSPEPEKVETAAIISKETNLQGMHNGSPDASELEEKNALALAIVPVEDPSTAIASNGISEWELALATVPCSNETISTTLAGGMEMLTLDSLYDDALRRASHPPSYNPWELLSPANNPFLASNAISAPYSIQMAAMAQQQQMMMMMSQHHLHQPSLNPFGSSYGPINPYSYGLITPIQSSNAHVGLI